MIRRPCAAGRFYPGSPDACKHQLEQCLAATDKSGLQPSDICAGLVPHAGWVFSGPTAARVYKAIHIHKVPRTFVFLGAVHVPGVTRAAVWEGEGWETPLGIMPVDQQLTRDLLSQGGSWLESNTTPHADEHSIEVQLPFVQQLFPQAQLVAIMVPPTSWAHEIGTLLHKVVPEDAVVIGSTDLTHYGAYPYGFAPQGEGEQALQWVKQENDRAILELIMQLEAAKIVAHAQQHHNACGAGAIAATLEFARARGRQHGHVLHYTTSHDVYPEKAVAHFVGYAGVVF